MGILRSEPQAYYASGGDHGSYRYIPLSDVIDSFTATYVGEGKLCENVVLNDVTFHAIRALQELSYDTFNPQGGTLTAQIILIMPELGRDYKATFDNSIETRFNNFVQSTNEIIECL